MAELLKKISKQGLKQKSYFLIIDKLLSFLLKLLNDRQFISDE